jgi:hypothetical protein
MHTKRVHSDLSQRGEVKIGRVKLIGFRSKFGNISPGQCPRVCIAKGMKALKGRAKACRNRGLRLERPFGPPAGPPMGAKKNRPAFGGYHLGSGPE